MGDNMENYELAELREQVTKLRDMLDKEAIVNERNIRRAMGMRAWRLKYRTIILDIVIVCFIPYILWVLPFVGADIWYAYVLAAFMALAVVYDIVVALGLSGKLFSHGSLVEISNAVVRYRRAQIYWICFSLPLVFIWGTMLIIELSWNIPAVIGFAVGGLVGLVFGAIYMMKTLRETQNIIDDINEITGKY